MGHLILVKHSLPEIDPNVPAPQWHLGQEGKQRTRILAERLEKYAPCIIVSSREPKAIETAEIVAEKFGLQNRVVEGLHEHERERVGWLQREELNRRIQEFFENPDALVLGDETANAALKRFTEALAPLAVTAEKAAVVAVTHGTVMSLYLAELMNQAGFELWKRLNLPAYMVLDVATMQVVEFCETVDAN